MDFDFTTETITPDTTNILTIGGTGGLEFPLGSTAQRPGSPQNGLIRYNSTTETVECFVSNSWASSMAPVMQQVFVQKKPGAGEFGSISEACASISGATAENLWEVIVGPGVYTEPEIVIPPYVNVSGIAEYEIVVQPDAPDHHVFVMSEHTSLNFLQVTGAGSGYAGVACVDSGNYALCHKVSLTNCDIGFLISAETKDSVVYLEYCDALGGTTGLSVTSSNGFSQYANLENWYIYDNPVNGMYISGPGTDVNMQAFGLEGADGTNTGLTIEDGATLAAKAGHIFGWNIGSHQTDNGDPTVTKYLGCAFHDNTTWDLFSEHIGNEGLLSGQARKDYVNAMASPAFVSAFSDPETNAFIQTGTFWMGATQANLTDVTDLIIDTPPVGLITGGALSLVSGLTANVSAGHGYLRKDGYMTRVQWPSTNITLPAGTLPYIYVDNNSAIQYSLSMPATTTTVLLGRAGTNATNIYTLGSLSTNITNYGNSVETWLRATVGPVFVSGSIVTENSTTPRAINVSAGNWYYGTQHRLPSAKTAPSITDTYKSGGVLTFATITQIPNDTYDNGTNLVPLTTGYYTKHTLYQASEGMFQAYTLVHGQAEYANLNDALEAPLPSPYIDPGPTPKIAAIIVQQGVNSLAQIVDVRPMFFNSTGTGTSGTNIHGDLLGLDADDHPQYLLVSGTRAMTGDLSLGNNDITDVATVNGVVVETHASRHQPNGADPIPTGPGVGVSTSTVNGTGTSNLLARADHTHALFGVQPLDATLTALAAYNTNGLLTQTAADTFTGRAITGTTNRVSVTNGNGVAGNPTIDIDSSYVGQTSITTLGTISAGTWNGSVVGTTYGGTGLSTIGTALQVLRVNAGATGLEYATINNGTVTSVSATQPAAGLTITGSPITTSGTLVFALANDLAAVEGLSTTGIAVRTATDTWTTRSVSGTTNRITVTNGDGVAGNPTVDISASYVGQNTITTLGTITTGVWNGTAVGTTYGGTGLTSIGTANQVLGVNTGATGLEYKSISAGTGISITPAAGSITIANTGVASFSAGTTGLTPSTATTGAVVLGGTLGIANGGTGQATASAAFNALSPLTTLGDILYGGTAGAGTRLAGNTTTTRQFLRQTGTGSVSAAPAWDTVTKTDVGLGNVENTALSTWPGSTNLTTLGTISTGTWNGSAIGATFGGTGQTTYAVGDILYANTTTTLAKLSDVATGNALISGGINTAPSWGKVGLTTHVSGILPVANGGTGLTTTPTNGQLLIGNGTGYSLAAITQGSGITVTNGSGTITLANTGVLSNVAGTGISVSGATGNVTITNTGVISVAGTTNQINVSASTGAVTLSLPQSISTTSSPTFASVTISNAPTNGTDATNKNYVDAAIAGLSWKQSVRAATTVAGTLASSFANGQVIDGITLVTGDRILIKNQATQTENGIYIVAASGAPARSADADTGTELVGASVYVDQGTVNADTGWTQTTNAPITIGSTNIVWAQFSGSGTYSAGTGLSLTGNTFANTGVLTNVAGTGISVSGATGNVTISNTGVTSVANGTGISVSGATGGVTITNTGVTSVAGTAGNITVSASTGVVTFNLAAAGTAGTYGTITTDAFGRVTSGSVVSGVANGGTGLSSLGTANQILGVNAGATALEYKTVTAGTGISISNGAGSITINNTGVTSVGLSLPSIFTVTGSPVTTTGTLTGTLATQAANTFLVGPVSGAAATPTFRTVGIDELSDVVITTPSTNQVIAYNGTNWVNTGAVGANASGLIGVGQSGAAAWTLVSGNTYRADFAHNLGTTNYTITIWDTSNNSVVGVQSTVATDNNTVRITVVGNTKTLKVVVVANGQSIVSGGSTPSSVITAKDGVTVSTAATKLNFTGQIVGVTDAGSGTTNINVGQRFTFFAASLDTPVNSDFAINSLAPMVATERPLRWYSPVDGVSSSPRMASSVDLPQPDGPEMETNSPRRISQ